MPSTTSILTTLIATYVAIRDPRPSYVSGFIIPQVSRIFPYGMPTAIMTGLQSSASTYTYNNATTASPFNPYVMSGSAISNTDRITQPGGSAKHIRYICTTMTPLTCKNK